MHRLLIVDDDPEVRVVCKLALQSDELHCDEAADGVRALEAVAAKRYDLVLLDMDMPGMSGPEVCRHLRGRPPGPHLKVILISGRATGDQMAQALAAGADDYLTKPFSVVQLRGRVGAALRLKDAQDRSDRLNQHLLGVIQGLERDLGARDGDLAQARNALILALAELVGDRGGKMGAQLRRVQRYCRCLAEEAAGTPGFTGQLDANFVEMLECCVPLYDIGMAALPDHILWKPGKLDADERVLMQSHTTAGSDALQKAARHHGFARAFLQMATEITRHHHERYDGQGYPDRLAGDAIPLAARIVAVADVYDALRSRRAYRPALPHAATAQMMVEDSAGQFDPALVQAFQRCAPRFERIYQELRD